MRPIDADAFDKRIRLAVGSCEEELTEDFKDGIKTILDMMKTAPTVEAVPVGRCKDCARNADNGGMYDDGRTRCPIQEHYVLLLDGYCHLWEECKDGEQI